MESPLNSDMKKRLLIIIFSILAIMFFWFLAKRKGWLGDKNKTEVFAEKAVKRTIVEMVSANGEIQPETEVKISADVSGEIVELFVKEGQKVKKGEHLLTINPDLIKSATDRVEATLNQVKATLSNAKSREILARSNFTLAENNFNRSMKLHTQKVISDAEMESATTQFEAAKADLEAARQNTIAAGFSVKSAEASLREAQNNLSRTRIYAPAEGTISKLNVELGERVVGTAQMSGTELLRIADMREMEVNALVNENDIVRVQVSDTAIIEVDAFSGRKFRGEVTEIARSSETSPSALSTTTTGDKVVNFMVKIRILRSSYEDLLDSRNPDYSPFFPGMNATVDISTRQENDVISIPVMAVTTRSPDELKSGSASTPTTKDPKILSEEKKQTSATDDLREVVFLYRDGIAVAQEVITGIQDNDYIQIKKGLTEGQEVISGPYSAVSRELKTGMKVKIKENEKMTE